MQQKERVRVYALARELDMDSKDLVELCRQQGIDVKNQLSSLEPQHCDQIKVLVKKGMKGGVALAPSPPPSVPVVSSTLDNRVRQLPPQRKRETALEALEAPAAPAAPAATVIAADVAPPAPAEIMPVAPASALVREAPPPPAPAKLPETVRKPGEPVRPADQPSLSPLKTSETPLAPVSTAPPAPVPDMTGKIPSLAVHKVPTLGTPQRPDGPRRPPPRRPTMMNRPGMAQPPSLKKLTTRKEEEKKPEVRQKPIAPLSEALKKGNLSPQELKEAAKTMVTGAPVAPVADFEEDEEAKKDKNRPGGVVGRDQRHAKRSQRQAQRKERQDSDVRGGRVLGTDDDHPRHQRRLKDVIKRPREGTRPRIGKVPIQQPITVRALSEAVGVRAGDLLFKLRDHGAPATITINSTVDPVMAELVAHDAGCELEIKKALDAEELLLGQLNQPDQPEDLVPRAPIVTIMGHVDHGKTTLLDKIRQSNVAATEAGGITQVIRAWRVEHKDKDGQQHSITFLDTPGHEAFTKMRARGANVTDIAVIVVAADDGVMPQTEEAINHARAAGVSMVVCINKVDLPNANINRTRQQLYGLNLLPDNMGGDIPFVETSAAKGKGIDDLLEAISIVAELKELKSNSDKPGRGTCLEAQLSEGEGVRATLLVREGTLRKSDVVLCGSTYGRVRAMYDDLGRPIQEAGPSVPVCITGLDRVPDADDAFTVVPELAEARDIAGQRQTRRQESSVTQRPAVTLESLSEAKIAELKIILKADFRGSIEAIRKELEKLAHDEVRLTILHAAIGGITESDVVLALTSPQDTIIVGFNVVPDDRAHALAEERDVQVREYAIIYNLTDDIKSALQGKLKPQEQVVHLGRAVVRKTFKVGRVGTVAGCYVTQGVIERSGRIRLIRQGVVIYPPPDRVASLDSLKRFKDDAREVREGFECGMKIAGYDDIKVDDVIEAYRVEQVQRTL